LGAGNESAREESVRKKSVASHTLERRAGFKTGEGSRRAEKGSEALESGKIALASKRGK